MAKNETDKDKKVKKHFFREFKAELKKVIWLTPKQLVNNTTAVLAIVLITGAIVIALDMAFEAIDNHVITNLQQQVESKFAQEEEKDNSGDSEEQNNSTENNENEETPEGENTEGEENSTNVDVTEVEENSDENQE